MSSSTFVPAIRHNTANPGLRRAKKLGSRAMVYAALLFWTFVSLFPIYWTVTTSFKVSATALVSAWSLAKAP